MPSPADSMTADDIVELLEISRSSVCIQLKELAEWGLIEAPGGGIMGVYSLSEAPPVKSGGFSKPDESFADALRYADWKFFYAPRNNPPGPSAAR